MADVLIVPPSAFSKVYVCWLCGLVKTEETIKKESDKFMPIWGEAEIKLKRQRAAKILLIEDGQSDKDIGEGDCVCHGCKNQINRRISIMEGRPFGSGPAKHKQKVIKKRKGQKVSDNSSSSDLSDSDVISVSSGSSPKKRKSSDSVPKKPPITKTGRLVKAPERFIAEKPPEPPNKRPPTSRATTPKARPIRTEPPDNVVQPVSSTYQKKPSSVSSLKLAAMFGETDVITVEICIDNVASAISAFKGGARRIELCASLSEGGLTPTTGFLREVKSLVKLPVFVMIRPRGGDFLYSDGEIDVMKYDIKNYKHNGADGFVFGVLDKTGHIDVAKCRALLQAADPLPCTFHRAFDYVMDPVNSLETVIKLGFSRLLTSGQKATASEGIPLLKKLVEKSAGRIAVMAGAGIDPHCVGNIVAKTGIREVHGSARTKIFSEMKRDKKGGLVAMGQNPADDMCLLVTDANAVAQIVRAAEDAVEATKLITIL